MKRITFILALLLSSVFAFGQTTIPIGQVDTTSSNGIQSKAGLVTAYGNLKSAINASKRQLGTVVNNSLTASTGYTASGSTTTWTFTGSGLTTSGGSNDNTNYQAYTGYYTNVTNYTQSITFKPTAYGNGVGIGINSNNGQLIARMTLNSGGTATLYLDVFRSGTIYNKVTGANTLTFALNDNIQLSLIRSGYNFTVLAQDLTSGVSVSCNVSDPLTYGEIAFIWAAGNPTIFHYGGSQTISNHTYQVNSMVQNDVVIYGNSIAVGMQSANPNTTFANLLGQYYPGGVNLVAGGGNATAQYLQLVTEIYSLKPRIVIFTDGINDVIAGVSAGTTEANITTFINDCNSRGIIPVVCTILPISGTYGGGSNATWQANIVTLNTWINALKNCVIIDTYTALVNAGVLNSSYDSGDGLHLNAAGQLQYYNTLYTTLSGNYLLNVQPNPATGLLSTANNWTQAQTLSLTNLAATATDGWKLINTTAALVGTTTQQSPAIHLSGNEWNPTAAASQAFDWKFVATGASVNPITTNLVLSSQINGAGYAANQFQWTNIGQTLSPTFASTAATTSTAFQSYYSSATQSNFYLLSAGGNNIASNANLNFAGASAINYRWFMAGGTAISPGGNNAVSGGLIGTQHVAFPTTGVTPLIAQLVIKPLVVDAGSGGTVSNTATLELEGAATGTVTGANYDLWAHGLNRLDSLATNITGLIKGNGNAAPATAAVAGTDYVGLASANTLTGVNTFNTTSIATTQTDQVKYTNTTAALAGTTIQYSPSENYQGNAWNTTALASQAVNARWTLEPTSGNPIGGNLALAFSVNGGAYSDKYFFGNGGAFTGTTLIANTIAIATTSTVGIKMDNTTAATSGVPVQYSAFFELGGTGWSGSASQTALFKTEVRPVNGTAPITASQFWAANINAGGYADIMSLANNSTLSVKHFAGLSSAPTIAAGTGAGTTPTVSVSGTDASGIVNITTGTSPSGSNAIVATITFNTAYASAPKGIVLVPANTNAAALTNATQVFVPANGQTNGTTTTTFVVEANGTALAASTAYIWTYHVIQ